VTTEERRCATTGMRKCECGNVARAGETQCGRCARTARAEQDLLGLIDDLNPHSHDFGDDLRTILRQLAERN